MVEECEIYVGHTPVLITETFGDLRETYKDPPDGPATFLSREGPKQYDDERVMDVIDSSQLGSVVSGNRRTTRNW